MSDDFDPSELDNLIPFDKSRAQDKASIAKVNAETKALQEKLTAWLKWPALEVPAIFAELEPINYLIEGLDICPGAPTLLAGYGFGGKTILAQSMALSIASGAPVLGQYECKKGRVLHIDYEQGARLTRARYQRLAKGMELKPEDIDGHLTLVSMPQFYMDKADATDWMCKVCEGYSLVIVDSFRASSPTIDENDSISRGILDKFTTISEKTGCCAKILHHAKKSNNNQKSDLVMDIRGSGAFYDASANVFVLDSQQGKAKKLVHLKARNSGVTIEPLTIQIFDVEVDGDPRGGVVVRATEQAKDGETGAAGPTSYDVHRRAILKVFSEHPEPKSGSEVATLSGKGRNPILATFKVMVGKGELVKSGAWTYRLDISKLITHWEPGDA